MGAVFAMFSGWYFWIPKMLGLNYNILLSKVQFWILFIGVKKKGSISGISKRWYSESSSRGSPFNPLSGQAYGPVPRPKGGKSKLGAGVFIVRNFSDIWDKIIPLFKNHEIRGIKREDFEDWIKVAEIIKSRTHLTEEGIDKIREIKSGMNSNRSGY